MKKFVIFILCLCFLSACGGSDHKSIPPEEKYLVTYTVNSECFKRARIDYDDPNGRHYIDSDLPFIYHHYCVPGDFLYISADPEELDPNCPDCIDFCIKISYQFGITLAKGCMSQPGDRWITTCYTFHIPDYPIPFD